jgi:hypothetical protein
MVTDLEGDLAPIPTRRLHQILGRRNGVVLGGSVVQQIVTNLILNGEASGGAKVEVISSHTPMWGATYVGFNNQHKLGTALNAVAGNAAPYPRFGQRVPRPDLVALIPFANLCLSSADGLSLTANSPAQIAKPGPMRRAYSDSGVPYAAPARVRSSA